MIKAKGDDVTISFSSSTAFRLDLSSASTIYALAARLRSEIPGLTTDIGYDIRFEVTVLRARYACPCGEISNLSVAFYGEPRSVPEQLERIKCALRNHIRAEGNEPNF